MILNMSSTLPKGTYIGYIKRPQVWKIEIGYLYNTLHQLFAVLFTTVQINLHTQSLHASYMIRVQHVPECICIQSYCPVWAIQCKVDTARLVQEIKPGKICSAIYMYIEYISIEQKIEKKTVFYKTIFKPLLILLNRNIFLLHKYAIFPLYMNP